MRILYCWTNISGYMAALWRRLGLDLGHEVRVLGLENTQLTAFDTATMEGLDWRRAEERDYVSGARVFELIGDFHPDVVILAGWAHKGFRELPQQAWAQRPLFVLAMDTPWRDEWRQSVAGVKLRRYLEQMDAVVLPNERAAIYAARLGFAPHQMLRAGIYGYAAAAEAMLAPQPVSARRDFLYLGRLVAEKGLPELIAAYQSYRAASEDPWKLICCGIGPLESAISSEPGVELRGFVQPRDLPSVFAESGCFVMPSLYEPWGVALAEACAAGLPVICSPAVGASLDMVRDGYNGFVIDPKHQADMVSALREMTALGVERDLMGARSQALAAPFESKAWAIRVERFLARKLQQRGVT